MKKLGGKMLEVEMATVDNLHVSITQMTDDEVLDLLRSIRAQRRLPRAVKEATKRTAKPAVLVLSSLSTTQAEDLLAELERMMQ